MTSLIRLIASAAVLAAPLAAAEMTASEADNAVLTIAAGDVGTDNAVLWVQGQRAGPLLLEVRPEEAASQVHRLEADLVGTADFTAKLTVAGLAPGTAYRWQARFADGIGATAAPAAEGRFETAPPPDAPAGVHLVWGADLAGQNVCRDAARGFEIFDPINAAAPTLFIGLGDMIYADGACRAEGRYGNAQIPKEFGVATDLNGFRAHWRYSRGDPGLRRLLASTAYYAVWDDHEVVNDFGPLHDTREEPPYRTGEHLLPAGLAAMLEQNPIAEHPLTPKRLYRAVQWGRHLELLLLDTRQYRDANAAPDSPSRQKTMLGREQLTWVEDRLERSAATRIVIVSSVPMSIPTGWPPGRGRDGWADFDEPNGFELELREILRHAVAVGRRELVFITADVHFSAAFRYRPFPNADLTVHEFVVGPLSAGVGSNDDFDPSLRPERLFLHAPPDPKALSGYQEARRFFAFGELRVDPTGVLHAALRGVDGQALFALTLPPPVPPAQALAQTHSGSYIGGHDRMVVP
ncbi:MAG: alkaline phosphatase D family protein [Thiohalocapsa sp.]|nr:alkaline phosphatase D family protein [Thiohalocapsa sp.]